MPRIYQQAKTVFAPLRYIVAAGLSVAFATSAFAQVIQPRQAEPTRSEVTPHEGTNEKVDAKVCMDADIERYVLNLGTLKLTKDEFEALVRCGASAVPALSQALKNDRAGVRTSAAYILGRIGKESAAAIPELIATLKVNDSNARAAAAYALGEIGPKAIEAVPSLTLILKDENEDFAIRYRAAYALKQIGSIEAVSAFNEYKQQIVIWSSNLTEQVSHSSSMNTPPSTQYKLRFRRCYRRGAFSPCRSYATGNDIDRSVAAKVNRPIICSLPGIQNIFPRCQ